jgi:hypothetical protein
MAGQMFYLFRARGGVNGIPLPGSAQYRLWIQPRSRHLAENSGSPRVSSERVAPAQGTLAQPCG